MERPGDEQFVKNLTACQLRLRSYIMTLLPDADAADDVLQNANAVMWRKRDQFTGASEFGAWACKIAYYEVLAHHRGHQRDRHVFDDELLGRIATTAEQRTEAIDQPARWLEQCLAELPAERRAAILERYQPGGSVQALAAAQGKSPGAMTKQLARIRQTLFHCIRKKMSGEDAP